MRNRTVFLSLLLTLLTLPFVPCSTAQSSAPVLWYWQSAYPESLADVNAIESQISQAASYGYTGVSFWSATFAFMGSTVHPANNVAYMQQLIAYAQSLGMQTMATTSPYGYSDDALINNPNWAEGEHITGSQFTVNASKTALVPVNSFGGLVNPGFESGLTGWFGLNDPNMGIDPSVAHSGNASGYVTNAVGNSRFEQTDQPHPVEAVSRAHLVQDLEFLGLRPNRSVGSRHQHCVVQYSHPAAIHPGLDRTRLHLQQPGDLAAFIPVRRLGRIFGHHLV